MEIFGFKQYRNMVDDPFLAQMSRVRHNDFCACGMNATGEDIPQSDTPEAIPDAVPAGSLQAWRYARTALMLVGLYVVGKFLYNKIA